MPSAFLHIDSTTSGITNGYPLYLTTSSSFLNSGSVVIDHFSEYGLLNNGIIENESTGELHIHHAGEIPFESITGSIFNGLGTLDIKP